MRASEESKLAAKNGRAVVARLGGGEFRVPLPDPDLFPVRTRTRAAALLFALIALTLAAAAQLIGIRWYFQTHLDYGIGG